MKVGVLGAGFMGGTHARAYAKLADVQVVAVSSRTPERAAKLAEEVGAKAVTDEMTIIHDPAIDAVSITLPTNLHKQYTLAALQAGKHVLVEKPFALNVADCDAMMAAQAQSGKYLMVAHVLRFWPEYVAIAKVIQSGKLGKPLSAVASRLTQAPAWSSWFTDPDQSGGPVLDLMIHDIDALNWVLGQPKSVYARGYETKPGLWDHMLTLIDYGTAQASIEDSEILPAGYPFSMALKIYCEGGVVEYDYKAGGVSVEMGGGIDSLMVYEPGNSYPLDAPGGDAWEAQIAYFVDCVRNGQAPTLGTPQQARLAVEMANAARQSLESGQVVPIA
ncbi:MAG: Gfo/Idh/MocA family oxidoreductase [Chloroflexi bacterium]|nr:Gfo/Idh/MocA family oxidoreductase [Chloroflexota bacterium]